MTWLTEQLRLLIVATQFLTRLPIPQAVEAWMAWTPERLRAASRYFPLVGLIVGGLTAGVYWVATQVWERPLAAAMSLACAALFTGAFHEDGFVDYADSFGGANRERALTIMKDSRIGTYGALAAIFLFAIKWLALMSLSRDAAIAALLLAHTAG